MSPRYLIISPFPAFDVCFVLFSMFITTKFSVVEFYVKQIGHFEGKYDTVKKQSELINHCAKIHVEIVELMNKCSNVYKFMALLQSLATVGLLVLTFLHILIVSFLQKSVRCLYQYFNCTEYQQQLLYDARC